MIPGATNWSLSNGPTEIRSFHVPTLSLSFYMTKLAKSMPFSFKHNVWPGDLFLFDISADSPLPSSF